MLTVVGRGPADIEKPIEIVRRSAARQPWAWDGLCFACPFHEASNEGFRDIANNVAPSEVNAVGWITDDAGNTAANMGNTSYVGWPDHPQHDRPSTAITIYVRLKRVGTSDAWGGIVVNYYATTDPWDTWAIYQQDTGAGTLGAMINLNGVRYAWDEPTVFPSTEYVNIFMRWARPGSPNLSVFGNRGNLLSSINSGVTDTSGDSLTYAAGMGLRLNASEILTENYSAHYSQVMVWNRSLSNIEVASLVSDPFGWYSPRRETVVLAGPFPIIYATTFRVHGYAMFATSTERDDLRAEIQAWLDLHPSASDVWPSTYVVDVAGTETVIPAGIATPSLMSLADPPTGPHPGLTWSYQVASKELRDSFGSIPGIGSVWEAGALEGSQFGESTD